MSGPRRRRRLAAVAALVALLAGPLTAAPEDDPAARLVGEALVASRAWDKLAHLSDRIGHRLSGSQALERAVAWAVEQLRRDGIERVWTEPVMVPHWVRGPERVRIVAPIEADLVPLALGGSVPTPEGGLVAEVVAVRSLEELAALGAAAQGKIVLFNRPMRRNGGESDGYGAASRLRSRGPSAAAKLGAVGMLIRSLGTADFRLPHTGALRYEEGVAQIPSAAIAAEDAALIQRLLDAGDTVRVEMILGCKTLPDVESANVLAELPGRELPQEIVVIGAHLDSWDVGQGAIDDGAGCAIVMEAMRLLARLERRPRRTVRAVLFTNEENGLRGGNDYATRHAEELPRHVAAIESDSGAGSPLGFGVTAGEGGVDIVRALAAPLAAIGATDVASGGGGADIGPLRRKGVPVMSLRQDTTYYFDYHHTAADTLDKVERAALDRNVTALAWMAWSLAERAEPLPRVAPETEEPR